MHALYGLRMTRPLLWYLCVALVAMAGLPSETLASFVPQVDTRDPHGQPRSADLAKIQRALELSVVRQRLLKLGLTEEETSARLARLADDELHELALRLDEVGAGGSDVGVNGDWGPFAVLALALILALIVYLVRVLSRELREPPQAGPSGGRPLTASADR